MNHVMSNNILSLITFKNSYCYPSGAFLIIGCLQVLIRFSLIAFSLLLEKYKLKILCRNCFESSQKQNLMQNSMSANTNWICTDMNGTTWYGYFPFILIYLDYIDKHLSVISYIDKTSQDDFRYISIIFLSSILHIFGLHWHQIYLNIYLRYIRYISYMIYLRYIRYYLIYDISQVHQHQQPPVVTEQHSSETESKVNLRFIKKLGRSLMTKADVLWQKLTGNHTHEDICLYFHPRFRRK